LDLFEGLTASGELGDDSIDSGGPNEGLWVLIPCAQEVLDRSD